MIPTFLFIGWSLWHMTSVAIQTPAWWDTGRPPAGCYRLKQFPRHGWLVRGPHKTHDVLCWQNSQLSQEE